MDFILARKCTLHCAKARIGSCDINSQVEDTLSGIRVVKSFTNEEIEKRKFANEIKDLSRAEEMDTKARLFLQWADHFDAADDRCRCNFRCSKYCERLLRFSRLAYIFTLQSVSLLNQYKGSVILLGSTKRDHRL